MIICRHLHRVLPYIDMVLSKISGKPINKLLILPRVRHKKIMLLIHS
jgi:hypothetical protein